MAVFWIMDPCSTLTEHIRWLKSAKTWLQKDLFVYTDEIRSSLNAFYQTLNKLLYRHGLMRLLRGKPSTIYASRKRVQFAMNSIHVL